MSKSYAVLCHIINCCFSPSPLRTEVERVHNDMIQEIHRLQMENVRLHELSKVTQEQHQQTLRTLRARIARLYRSGAQGDDING